MWSTSAWESGGVVPSIFIWGCVSSVCVRCAWSVMSFTVCFAACVSGVHDCRLPAGECPLFGRANLCVACLYSITGGWCVFCLYLTGDGWQGFEVVY
jgi:hypothetical protein